MLLFIIIVVLVLAILVAWLDCEAKRDFDDHDTHEDDEHTDLGGH